MQGLLARGHQIPRDFKIVGMDDVEYAKLLPVPLTTIHQPCREIGQAAMAAMLDRIRNPDMLASSSSLPVPQPPGTTSTSTSSKTSIPTFKVFICSLVYGFSSLRPGRTYCGSAADIAPVKP